MRSIDIVLGSPMIVSWVVLHAIAAPAAEEAISFNKDIRPLLSDRCFACHGPDAEKREGELRLDAADGDGSPFQTREGRPTIHSGKPELSELWTRLITDDHSLQMPPPDSGKKPLTDGQKELVRRWILQGAKYEKFWSLESTRPQSLPRVKQDDWATGRIDQFVLANLEKNKRTPQTRADKRTLIRRVTLDLTGLPPTLQEIDEFEQDDAPDSYVQVVDRLLSSPQYGEHLGRYWLDLVRYADTNGMHHDHYRELSQYRDWVIRACNANMPFNQFATEQLAGDLLENATIDQRIASGYNRLHMVMDRGTNPPQESYTRNVVDQVTAFGTVFMGMTMECAVCHDHKYDPIKQKDFFQLFAFFNNIDGDPETPGRNQQPPLLRLPSPEQETALTKLDSQIAVLKEEVESLKKLAKAQVVGAASGTSEEASAKKPEGELPKNQDDSLPKQIKSTEEDLRRLQAARDAVERDVPIALVMKERTDLRPAFILTRGAYDQPGEEVSRGTPGFLPPLRSEGEAKTRLDLARWLTDREHPLLARVTVNRFWQQFFGVGLVKTSEDFGAQGEYPTHPELLDDLANAFIESDWNVKGMIRSIVLSQTYQQSSRVSSEEYRADAENRQLARGSRIRLDSEVIRDQILAVSGLLNNAMYGKSVKPPQPADLWKTVSMVSSSTYSFQEDTGEKIYRRSFYTFWKRAMPPPQMTIFDAPTRESCTSRRERTNTPIQALLLMNENQYFQAARHFAQDLLRSPKQSDEDRLSLAYESVTSHLPDAVERASLLRGLESFRSVYRDDLDAARAMTSDLSMTTDMQRIELAAYTMVINSLFNLDATKTRE